MGPPGSASYRRIVVTLAAGGLANFALLYYVQPLLPELAAAFHIPPGASGLALSSTTFGMIVGLLLAGPVSDRIGRVPTMAVSLAVAGALGGASAAAPTWEAFLVARLAMGVALAILPAVALAYVKDQVADDAHLHANSAYIVGTALGGAIGRIVPLPLTLIGGWQTPTILFSTVSVAAGVVLFAALPRDQRRSQSIRVSDVLRGTFSSYRDRTIALICALGFANTAIFITVYNAVAFRLSNPPFSLGDAEALVYVAYAVCIFAPPAFRASASREGRPAAVLIGICLTAAAVVLLVFPTVVTVFVGLAVLTFAFMGTHSILSGWAVHTAHHVGRSTSRASSAYLLSFYVGSTVASAISTQLWVAAGWTGIMILSAALAVSAAALLGAVAATNRRSAVHASGTDRAA